jgi:hypothetical protein
MNGCRNIHADVVDRFRVNKKESGKNDICRWNINSDRLQGLLMVMDCIIWTWYGFVFDDDDDDDDDAYIKRKNYLGMLPILQRITEEIWQKTHIHRWC